MFTSSSSRDHGRFDELAEEFVLRYRRGERPSLQEYVDRLPEMADEILEMFPALVEVERVEADVRVEALLAVQDRAGSVPSPDSTGTFEGTSAGMLAATQAAASAIPPGSEGPETLAHAEATEATGILGEDATLDGPAIIIPNARPDGLVPGRVIVGRYTLRDVLGEGGMGTVYRADQIEPVKRQVALKLIRAGMDSRAILVRFNAERQALALMDHPNIARVFDGGTTEHGQPYFVMELVQGVPITDYCDRKHLSVKARLELFVAVCHAVQHAHQKGIIHRDLKPSNVLVTEVDGRATPKVIDFGVAKATEFDLTDQSLGDTGAIVGTPTYMSPEQADPSTMDIDTRTDVYALGVVLYELLAGSPPLDPSQFQRGALLEMLRMVREVDPPKPSTKAGTSAGLATIAAGRGIEPAQLKRALAGDLDWIVMKAMEKDRTRRYETANGLAADILRHLASEPVLAAPPSRAYRLRKFVRKHRGAVTAAGLVLLALVAGFIGTTWGLIQAERANAALKAKNVELAAEKIKVERRFELAHKAIGTFHTGVSEDVLLKNEQFRDLRTKLLGEAARFYGDLERLLAGQTDAKSRKLLAAGYHQLGDLTDKIGESTKAVAVLRKALEVRKALAAESLADLEPRLDVARTQAAVCRLLSKTGDSPGELKASEELRGMAMDLERVSSGEDAHEVLADSYSALGMTLDNIGKIPPSREAWRKGAEIRRRLADAHPTDPKYQFDLAKCYSSEMSVQVMMPWSDMEEALIFQEKGVKILEKLVRDHPTSTEYQYWLALSVRDVGWAQGVMLWKPKEAETAFIASLPLWRKLTETYPAVNAYQVELAQTYAWFGWFQTYSGRWRQALDYEQKSLAILQRLIESEADFPWNRIALALSSQYAGELLEEIGEESGAMEALRRSVVMGEKAVDGDPASAHYRMYLARHQEAVGTFLKRIGKPAEAMKTYSEAYAMRRRNAEALPEDAWTQRDLAENRSLVGRLYRDTGKLPEALDAVQASLPIRRKLVAADPTNPKYQSFLSSDLILAASILLRLGRTAEARALLEEAIPIQSAAVERTPGYAQHAAVLAHGYLRSGQVRQAEGDKARALADWKRAIEVLRTIPDLRGPEMFLLACCHAARSGAATRPEEPAAEAEQAIGLLKKATGMSYRNPATFRSETALEPVRNRDDFKKLMTGLEERATKTLVSPR